MKRAAALALAFGLFCLTPLRADDPKPLKVLFLGDNGHHKPAERYRQLEPVLAKRGIELVYTDKVDSLNAKNLENYDALVIYANTTKITAEQEKALLDYVEGGKGIVPLHCASYCFLNSPKYIELVGAQFKEHKTGTFKATPADTDHPIMKGYAGFESFDETYVHTKHNEKDRTFWYRVDGTRAWTWVRTRQGRRLHRVRPTRLRARVPGCRSIRWSVGQDPRR